jgi:NADH-quinone oxidoreductase subunit F
MKFRKIEDFKDYCEKVRKRKREDIRIKVCITGCRAKGAIDLFKEFKKREDKEIEVIPTGCHKFCSGAPVVKVELFTKDYIYQNVCIDDIDEIIKNSKKDKPVERILLKDKKFFESQVIKVLKNCGEINPVDIDDYIYYGGFSSFLNVIENFTPDKVIEELRKSKLRGRGGAGFPTYKKWEIVKNQISDEKFVICNGDEGDPGAFMDRTLLEGVPFQIIEGMLICGFTIGSNKGFFYIRAEYPIAILHISQAIKECYKYGLLGKNILGTGFGFDIEIKKGAGAFVCGEETALIASIEGKRGMPRPRPPFPAEKGLFGKPTCINNVETFANIPIIINEGGENFCKTGTEKSGGTKIFSLAGKVKNTGLVEIPLGTPLWKIIYEIGGGPIDGRKIKGVQTGGPSGGCIPVEYFNTPTDYETLAELGSIMGSGGMIVIDDKVCAVELARYFLDFVQKESCGKCVPCRIGTKRMLEILERITKGKGEIEDIKKLEKLGNYIKDVSLCGLGQTAPNPVLTTLKYFKDEYLEHIILNYCKAGQCKEIVYSPCTNACPAGIDIPEYISAIEKGDFIKAYEIICNDLPFPSICGRACYSPCENMCRRKDIDQAVGIRVLKKFVCDYAWKKGISLKDFTILKPEINKRVAVIGGGICGLTCAYFLSKEGIRVDIYEKENELGGTVKKYIPEFRLPKKIVEKEIKDILNERIKVFLKKTLFENLKLEQLEKEYDAIFISIGAMPLFYNEKNNIYDGLEFLKKVKEGKKINIGENVGVIGGGNVAIDCARVAKRLGAENVYIIYRRTEEYMPAHKTEIEEAKKEKIKFLYLLSPEKTEFSDGKIILILKRMGLADVIDKDGRRKIIEKDEKIEMKLDTLIYAIGQKTKINEYFKEEDIDRFTLKIKDRKIFVGGDFYRGPSSIIDSIGDGKRAAFSILNFLTGREFEYYWIKDVKKQVIEFEESKEIKHQNPEYINLKERLNTFKEVEKTYTIRKAIKEAKRCLKCHLEK